MDYSRKKGNHREQSDVAHRNEKSRDEESFKKHWEDVIRRKHRTEPNMQVWKPKYGKSETRASKASVEAKKKSNTSEIIFSLKQTAWKPLM